jgi:hypothetical protein
MPLVASEAVEEALGDPAAGTTSTVVAPPPLTAGADVDAPSPPIAGAGERAAEVAEPSSVQPTAAVEEVAPATSQPTVVPQERDAPEGVARATSPEIQETGEGSGAALLQDTEDGDAQILDLAKVSWGGCFRGR